MKSEIETLFAVTILQSVTEVLNCAEVYRELITRGYEYGHYFQGVQRSSVEGKHFNLLYFLFIHYTHALKLQEYTPPVQLTVR